MFRFGDPAGFVWLVLLLDNGREDAQKASAGARFSGIKPLGVWL